MLKDITNVKLLDGFRLHITFEDDVEGIVDIQELIEFTGIFSPLANPEYFSEVTVDPALCGHQLPTPNLTLVTFRMTNIVEISSLSHIP